MGHYENPRIWIERAYNDNALFTIRCSPTNTQTRIPHNNINRPVLPPTTTTAGHGGDEDDFGGYNELLSLDVDWDLLAPSPLLRMDGFVGRAQQQHPQAQPLAHMVKAEPAVDGGMMGYGLI